MDAEATTTTTQYSMSNTTSSEKIEIANKAEGKAYFAYLLYRETKFKATKPFTSEEERLANRKAIYETFAAYEVALKESLDAGWECFQNT